MAKKTKAKTRKAERAKLLPCPFCGGAVQPRDALWPSEGDVDGIIHANPTNCPLGEFSLHVADEGVSVAAAWNTRSTPVPCAGEKEGWRPIDTAPHQKAVLVAREDEKFIVEAYVPNPASGWRHVHSCDPVCFMPTHWQPLPSPPGATPSPPRQGVEREKVVRVFKNADATDWDYLERLLIAHGFVMTESLPRSHEVWCVPISLKPEGDGR